MALLIFNLLSGIALITLIGLFVIPLIVTYALMNRRA